MDLDAVLWERYIEKQRRDSAEQKNSFRNGCDEGSRHLTPSVVQLIVD